MVAGIICRDAIQSRRFGGGGGAYGPEAAARRKAGRSSGPLVTGPSVYPQQSPGQLGGEGPTCEQAGDKVVLLTTGWDFQGARGNGWGLERVRKAKRIKGVQGPGDLSSIPEGLFYLPVEVAEAINPNADRRDKNG